MEARYAKFLDMIKEVRINVPLADVLAAMINYCKFLKDLVSNKSKMEQISAAFLTEECSAILQNKIPPKLRDPGNFVILQMEEDDRVPLIFRRPFLHIADAIIRVKNKELNLGIGEDRATFHIDKAMQHSHVNDDTCFRMDVIDEITKDELDALLDDSKPFLNTSEKISETPLDKEFDEFMSGNVQEDEVKDDFEELPPKDELRIRTSIQDPPTDLEMKPLPKHLEYAFLEENSLLPVVISALLEQNEKERLVSVLKNHKEAFAWKTSDIPGISPSFCKHKINFEDDVKPVIQRQRRLNPNMKEVVKKEIIKLLDAGIIYAIEDSPWVSPVHCVPKKGGMTVVTNEDNELVPTRTVTGWRVCIDYRKLNEATRKDHFPLPFMDQMLERLAGNKFFCFLDEFSRYFQIPIEPADCDPRVPLILGRPFLRIARALIDVHGEELILRDGAERLILNMKHDTSRYSNKPQRESINMIDIYNISYEYYLEDLFANEKITNHLSGNPTFSSEPDTLTSDLTSPEVKDDIFDPEGDIVLIAKLLNFDSTKDLTPSHNINPLSGSTTSSSPSLTTSEIIDYSLEEFADELALIESFPPGNDDMSPEDVIREIEYLLNRDPLAEYSPNNDLIYTIPEMFTDEHTLNYSSPPKYDDANDDLFDLKTDNDEWGKILYDDPFDSKENKIKDSKLLINELDSPGSSSFLPRFLESDSVLYEDFSEVDTLTSTDNEDKVFNPGILVHENLYEVTNRVAPDKNVKKISSSNASLILEDYNPPLSDHELPFQIEIPGSRTLLSFSSENEEKVFKPRILISKGVHSLLPKLSHRDSKAFKVINIFESLMEIFPCSYGEDIRAFGCFVISSDFEGSRARGFVLRSLELQSFA
ncbi:hypothetical protein Tco_0913995 [Tanacetum coccineum]